MVTKAVAPPVVCLERPLRRPQQTLVQTLRLRPLADKMTTVTRLRTGKDVVLITQVRASPSQERPEPPIVAPLIVVKTRMMLVSRGGT